MPTPKRIENCGINTSTESKQCITLHIDLVGSGCGINYKINWHSLYQRHLCWMAQGVVGLMLGGRRAHIVCGWELE